MAPPSPPGPALTGGARARATRAGAAGAATGAGGGGVCVGGRPDRTLRAAAEGRRERAPAPTARAVDCRLAAARPAAASDRPPALPRWSSGASAPQQQQQPRHGGPPPPRWQDRRRDGDAGGRAPGAPGDRPLPDSFDRWNGRSALLDPPGGARASPPSLGFGAPRARRNDAGLPGGARPRWGDAGAPGGGYERYNSANPGYSASADRFGRVPAPPLGSRFAASTYVKRQAVAIFKMMDKAGALAAPAALAAADPALIASARQRADPVEVLAGLHIPGTGGGEGDGGANGGGGSEEDDGPGTPRRERGASLAACRAPAATPGDDDVNCGLNSESDPEWADEPVAGGPAGDLSAVAAATAAAAARGPRQPTPAPPTAPDVDAWDYMDPAGAVQGPFTRQDLEDWAADGCLPPTLPTRPSASGAAWRALDELRPIWRAAGLLAPAGEARGAVAASALESNLLAAADAAAARDWSGMPAALEPGWRGGEVGIGRLAGDGWGARGGGAPAGGAAASPAPAPLSSSVVQPVLQGLGLGAEEAAATAPPPARAEPKPAPWAAVAPRAPAGQSLADIQAEEAAAAAAGARAGQSGGGWARAAAGPGATGPPPRAELFDDTGAPTAGPRGASLGEALLAGLGGGEEKAAAWGGAVAAPAPSPLVAAAAPPKITSRERVAARAETARVELDHARAAAAALKAEIKAGGSGGGGGKKEKAAAPAKTAWGVGASSASDAPPPAASDDDEGGFWDYAPGAVGAKPAPPPPTSVVAARRPPPGAWAAAAAAGAAAAPRASAGGGKASAGGGKASAATAWPAAAAPAAAAPAAPARPPAQRRPTARAFDPDAVAALAAALEAEGGTRVPMSPDFEAWAADQMLALTGSPSLALPRALTAIASNTEVADTVTLHLGSSPAVAAFAADFIRRKCADAALAATAAEGVSRKARRRRAAAAAAKTESAEAAGGGEWASAARGGRPGPGPAAGGKKKGGGKGGGGGGGAFAALAR